jgi:hypothetical protein
MKFTTFYVPERGYLCRNGCKYCAWILVIFSQAFKHNIRAVVRKMMIVFDLWELTLNTGNIVLERLYCAVRVVLARAGTCALQAMKHKIVPEYMYYISTVLLRAGAHLKTVCLNTCNCALTLVDLCIADVCPLGRPLQPFRHKICAWLCVTSEYRANMIYYLRAGARLA